jgi:hypothetical protein
MRAVLLRLAEDLLVFSRLYNGGAGGSSSKSSSEGCCPFDIAQFKSSTRARSVGAAISDWLALFTSYALRDK